MTQEELNALKQRLPRNYYFKIGKIMKCSKSLVFAVLAGTRKNDDILEAAIIMADENDRVKEEQKRTRLEEIKKTIDN